LRVVPNRLGGILTMSTSVETENKCKFFYDFQFMNLWVNIDNFMPKKQFFCHKPHFLSKFNDKFN